MVIHSEKSVIGLDYSNIDKRLLSKITTKIRKRSQVYQLLKTNKIIMKNLRFIKGGLVNSINYLMVIISLTPSPFISVNEGGIVNYGSWDDSSNMAEGNTTNDSPDVADSNTND